jgi:hypothetical protein
MALRATLSLWRETKKIMIHTLIQQRPNYPSNLAIITHVRPLHLLVRLPPHH